MGGSDSRQVLSRISDSEFVDREAELSKLCSLAGATGEPKPTPRARANALVPGPPRVGKSEILRKAFDRLFNRGGDLVPIYYSLGAGDLNPEKFARHYLSHFLAQFVAFRRDDVRLLAALGEPPLAISRAAGPDDYIWLRGVIDSFTRAARSGDASAITRAALASPLVAASHTGLGFLVLLDNVDILAESLAPTDERVHERAQVRSDLMSWLTELGTGLQDGAANVVWVLGGLRRPLIELIPGEDELFDKLEMVPVSPMDEDALGRAIGLMAARLGVEIGDSTAELMIHQLKGDLFYTRAVLDRAASSRSGLRSFMEFERAYTDEVCAGRIGHYLTALLCGVATTVGDRRAVLEGLSVVAEAAGAIPIDAVAERMAEHSSNVDRLLARMHAREMLEAGYGFVRASADSVLYDWVRTTYRREIAGASRPLAGEHLLAEKLKQSYDLMMSRYRRRVEAQLVQSLSSFDFQSVPASLLDQSRFEKSYRGLSPVQMRRSLDEEQDRVRLPQIVLVSDLGSGSEGEISWRLLTARGFEGGIYSDSSEVLWLIAMLSSREPVGMEVLGRIDQKLNAAMARTARPTRTARWYISKEGVSASLAEHLSINRVYCSTYAQLDLLQDYLIKLEAPAPARRPASEFELVIPIENEAELIAARTAEQIARAADFEQEAINQIKTALIEACINAAEHSDSPDRRIHQRFALSEDRLVITVSNKGRSFGPAQAQMAVGAGFRGSRGRGLQIIRALMDEVHVVPTDGGASLVMTKFLKRPEGHTES